MCACVSTTLRVDLTFHPESGALHWVLTTECPDGRADVVLERSCPVDERLVPLLADAVWFAGAVIDGLVASAPGPFDVS